MTGAGEMPQDRACVARLCSRRIVDVRHGDAASALLMALRCS
jgi:hypothetical protein